MPRAPRIQYEGAICHVMARGNRREPIVFDDQDRKCFVQTLGEVCQRTGWEVFAWVLLDNHYHLAIRTPGPNLVTGMSWFQNTFTRRINTRNQLWGHLFGGRYKAILVEDDVHGDSQIWQDYLLTLIDYIHLNPALVEYCFWVWRRARETGFLVECSRRFEPVSGAGYGCGAKAIRGSA